METKVIGPSLQQLASILIRVCSQWHWIRVEILERLRLDHCHNLMVST